MLDETKTDVKFKFCITSIKVTTATAALFVVMNNCQMTRLVRGSGVTKMRCSCVSLSPACVQVFELGSRLPLSVTPLFSSQIYYYL